jgi:tripartite-type tricarboxylate transporter receptor subunit TctC
MGKSKRYFFMGLALFFSLVLIGSPTGAQTQEKYPTKAIDIIIPWPAGGGTDMVHRFVIEYLKKKWGVSINPVNKPGGNGVPATVEFYGSAPDGYTMFGDNISTTCLIEVLVKNLPFKVMDRAVIATVGRFPQLLYVSGSSPINSLKDLEAAVKKNPSGFTWTSNGGASGTDWGIRQFFKAINVDVTVTRPIVGQGSAQSPTMVAGGTAILGCSGVPTFLPFLKGDILKPLAVMGDERHPDLPNIPTTAELGFPSVENEVWVSISGPPKLPAYIVSIWDNAIKEMTKDPDYISKLRRIGAQAVYRDSQTTKNYITNGVKEAVDMFGRR